MNKYFFLLLILAIPIEIFPTGYKRVLVLHSYDVGLSWTKNITEGIQQEFNDNLPDADIYYEFLDAKRIEDPLFFSKIKDILKLKYRPDYFDVIISSDNSAFDFLLKYRDELFPNIPYVFCGVNNFKSDYIRGEKGITGVAENIAIKETIDLIKNIHPYVTEIAVISDTTITSKENKKVFLAELPHHKDINFKFIHDVRQSELIPQLAKLPKTSVIILLSGIYDENGVYIPFEQSSEFISANCSLPIYGFWSFFLGHGVVGGKMLRGIDQGKAAGDLAIRILDGENLDSIQIIHNTPSRYMFDYSQLQRFNIPRSVLPERCFLVNEPEQSYTVNRLYIWVIVILLAFSFSVMISLAINMRNRRRSERDLLHKKLEAEKSDKLKSEFLAQISHEIRTPINTILNFTSLLREELHDKVEGELKSSFKIIENAGRRTIRTIDLILNMSEIQTGFYEPQFKRIDIAKDILERIYTEFKPVAETKDLRFNFVNLCDSSFVMADEYSMFQIFVNLIENAFKFTSKGKVEIIVFRNYADKLSVGIIDTGVGISKEYMGRLFEAFSQEEQGYTRRYEGNGLGLALVKKYAELNNAMIKVESEKDKGSRFTVIFN